MYQRVDELETHQRLVPMIFPISIWNTALVFGNRSTTILLRYTRFDLTCIQYTLQVVDHMIYLTSRLSSLGLTYEQDDHTSCVA
jgi:hypothetical protein